MTGTLGCFLSVYYNIMGLCLVFSTAFVLPTLSTSWSVGGRGS